MDTIWGDWNFAAAWEQLLQLTPAQLRECASPGDDYDYPLVALLQMAHMARCVAEGASADDVSEWQTHRCSDVCSS